MSKVKVDMENPETDQVLIERLTATFGIIPKDTEYDKQGYLINLDLSSLHITQLPEELGQLIHLQELYLHNNQLTHIPLELGQLPNLQVLSLHENQLTHILPELGRLPNLQDLSLDNNQLTHLPSELGQLANLQTLSLQNNQLRDIPLELGQLLSLQQLLLYNNQLTHIPPELSQLAKPASIDPTREPVEGQRYDPALYPLFLCLMERFDLCYQIDSQLSWKQLQSYPLLRNIKESKFSSATLHVIIQHEHSFLI